MGSDGLRWAPMGSHVLARGHPCPCPREPMGANGMLSVGAYGSPWALPMGKRPWARGHPLDPMLAPISLHMGPLNLGLRLWVTVRVRMFSAHGCPRMVGMLPNIPPCGCAWVPMGSHVLGRRTPCLPMSAHELPMGSHGLPWVPVGNGWPREPMGKDGYGCPWVPFGAHVLANGQSH